MIQYILQLSIKTGLLSLEKNKSLNGKVKNDLLYNHTRVCSNVQTFISLVVQIFYLRQAILSSLNRTFKRLSLWLTWKSKRFTYKKAGPQTFSMTQPVTGRRIKYNYYWRASNELERLCRRILN